MSAPFGVLTIEEGTGNEGTEEQIDFFFYENSYLHFALGMIYLNKS